MSTWQEDIDKICGMKMTMPSGPNPRVIKRILQDYKRTLEDQGKTEDEVKKLVMKKFKELSRQISRQPFFGKDII